MSARSVLVSVDADGIAVVTLNRPEVHNAFDDRLIAALTVELRKLDADARVRAVVIAGNGKSLSAGADLNWLKRVAKYSDADNLKDAMALAEMLHVLYTLSKPTVARVHGPAYGGGVGLVCCCDIAIATREAVFAFSEVRLGLIPGTISPYAVNAIGERMARRYFLTGERIDAGEAFRLGLVHDIAEEEELNARIGQVLFELYKGGPHALAAAKELIRAVARSRLDQDMVADTARRFAAVRASVEGREGIAAFLDKRAAAWTARAKPKTGTAKVAKGAKETRKRNKA